MPYHMEQVCDIVEALCNLTAAVETSSKLGNKEQTTLLETLSTKLVKEALSLLEPAKEPIKAKRRP